MRQDENGKWQVLMISSSADDNVFVLPKGGVEKGEKAKETAVRETLEEAGVTGELHKGKIGIFEYTTPVGNQVVQKMWLLYVTNELDATNPLWKERKRRERHWLSFDEAREHVGIGTCARNVIVSILNAARTMLTSSNVVASAS